MLAQLNLSPRSATWRKHESPSRSWIFHVSRRATGPISIWRRFIGALSFVQIEFLYACARVEIERKKVIGPNRAARVNHSRTKELLTLPYKGASLLGRGHFTFHTTYFNRRTAVPCRLQIWIKCVREDETFSPFQATLLLNWLIDTHTRTWDLKDFLFFCTNAARRGLSLCSWERRENYRLFHECLFAW